MPLSKEQQQALDRLPPPASLDRITRFLGDLGAQGSEPLGTSGRSAQSLAASLAERAHSYSARQTSGWVAILMDRYQIKVGEIQEFALWFVRRQEIFARTADLIEGAPDTVLARHPAPDQTLARPPAASPGTAPPDADGFSAPPRRMTLRRQAVAAAPAVVMPLLDGPPELALPDTTATLDPQTRRRQAGTADRPAPAPPRGRRIERGPVPVGSDALPGGTPLHEAPLGEVPQAEPAPGEAPQHEPALSGGPAAPPAPRRRFRLVPNMVTRPAFVANVGLAGMLAGLALTPATAMTQDAPFMALAAPPVPGAGLMPGAGRGADARRRADGRAADVFTLRWRRAADGAALRSYGSATLCADSGADGARRRAAPATGLARDAVCCSAAAFRPRRPGSNSIGFPTGVGCTGARHRFPHSAPRGHEPAAGDVAGDPGRSDASLAAKGWDTALRLRPHAADSGA